jgi:hypothetical protein
MDTQTITKEEFAHKLKELNKQIKTLPPEKRLQMLKEVNIYLRDLSTDLAELDMIIKEGKVEELQKN